MRVRALCDVYVNSCYRVAGAIFDYSGPPNRHLVPTSEEPEAEPVRVPANGLRPDPVPAAPLTPPPDVMAAVRAAAGLPPVPSGVATVPPLVAVPPAPPAPVAIESVPAPAAVPAIASVQIPPTAADNGADLLGGLG